MDHCMPMQDICHISLYGTSIYSQGVQLGLQKDMDMLQRRAIGILTPFTTPANKIIPPACVHCSSCVSCGSEDCFDSRL